VPLKEPGWWYSADGGGLTARLLRPVARAYGAIAEARFRREQSYRASLPVICVGNFTAGGTGKTPLTRLVLEHLVSLGERPVCLTRGYGGCVQGPVWVEPGRHRAAEVGDEPLLLARSAPVVVSRDRVAGARAIEAAEPKATVIVMDDGLQNPSLAKDLTIAVVDANRGMGNGHVIPAGPLRAPLGFQLGLVDCIVVNGRSELPPADAEQVFERLKRSFLGPVLRAEPQPDGDITVLAGAKVAAYAGIANPGRFFRLLEDIGAEIVHRVSFADHHEISETEAEALMVAARRLGATLVTTEKDAARLDGATGTRALLRNISLTLPIKTVFLDRDAMRMDALLGAELRTPKVR
jgi:tetraacyldisaccharide 4'-kinase